MSGSEAVTERPVERVGLVAGDLVDDGEAGDRPVGGVLVAGEDADATGVRSAPHLPEGRTNAGFQPLGAADESRRLPEQNAGLLAARSGDDYLGVGGCDQVVEGKRSDQRALAVLFRDEANRLGGPGEVIGQDGPLEVLNDQGATILEAEMLLGE